jgi:hypothetical protein
MGPDLYGLSRTKRRKELLSKVLIRQDMLFTIFLN